MYMLSRLASPIVSFLGLSTDLVLRLLGRHNVPEMPITEEDIMALVREGTEEGTVEAAEQALISSVFTFTDRSVRSLMTPRTQIVALEVDHAAARCAADDPRLGLLAHPGLPGGARPDHRHPVCQGSAA